MGVGGIGGGGPRWTLPLVEKPPWLSAALSARAAGETAAPKSSWFRDVIDFLFGDIGNLWTGGRDGFPYGKFLAGALRVFRVAGWLWKGAEGAIPVFANGAVGKLLTRMGISWLGTPGAVSVFRGLGIAGGVIGTGLGVYNLIKQGNPIDAFEREGAGYVADVASTAFSASTTAFFIAPNPVTAGFVIGTGLVWLGAEVVDHWDDISDAASDAADWVGDTLSDAGDWVSDGLDTIFSPIPLPW